MRLVVTASRASLERRAAMLAGVRAFFARRGVLEVETPALSSAAVPDPAIHPLRAAAPRLGCGPLFLHTSPELAMKRLLAAGVGDIYQVCRVFRDGEIGRWHQPEFTLLEWYRLGYDDDDLMTEVESLIRDLLPARLPRGSRRIPYADAFAESLGIDPDVPATRLAAALSERAIAVPAGLTQRALVDLAFAAVVAPGFDPDALTFVSNFPADQAALARLKPGHPVRAARFEAFCGGLEIANGFAELCDATEQRQRFERELAERQREGLECLPLDEDFLAALAAGLPPCAGVAVGFDRLVALATGARELTSCLSLAHRS
jgi:lysyl-tRNA synthetase class 2